MHGPPDHSSSAGAWFCFSPSPVLCLFLNPLIDFRGCDLASYWLMRVQRARCDLQPFGTHRLCKLLGLNLGRECFCLGEGARQGTSRQCFGVSTETNQ